MAEHDIAVCATLLPQGRLVQAMGIPERGLAWLVPSGVDIGLPGEGYTFADVAGPDFERAGADRAESPPVELSSAGPATRRRLRV